MVKQFLFASGTQTILVLMSVRTETLRFKEWKPCRASGAAEGRKEKREGRKCRHTHTKSNCGYGHTELSGLGVDEE